MTFRELLKKYKHRPADLAKALEVDPQLVNKWANNGIPMQHVFAVRDFIGCHYEELRPFQSHPNVDLLGEAVREVEAKIYHAKTAEDFIELIKKLPHGEVEKIKENFLS